MSAGPRVALAVLSFALLAVAVSGYAAADIGTGHSQLDTGTRQNLTIVIDLQPDGDARFTVSTTFNLTTEAQREGFRDLATKFKNGETSALGLPAYRRASRIASEATGRPMKITNETYFATPASEIENGTGRLAVQFTWTNFGRPDGERLHIDDVFNTSQGTWLPGLGPGDTLIIRAPKGYGVIDSNVAPKVRNNRSILQWSGPTEFTVTSTQAVFTGQAPVVTPTPTPTPTPPTPTPTPTDTATPPPNGRTPSGSPPWALLFTVGLGGGLVAVYFLARHRDGVPVPSSPSTGTGPSPDDGETATADAATRTGPESVGTDAEAGSEETGAQVSEATDIDEELLSDEERVERLLDQNGGRMKQADIVKETGWSNAKVSQLLSSMEDDGRIDKLRIGRENLISFPDVDVTDFDE